VERSTDSGFLACSYSALCAGCEYLHVSLSEQRALKSQTLHDALNAVLPGRTFPEPRWISIANGALRDRVDLMIDRRSGDYRVGLFDRFRTGLVDLQGCPQLTPSLESWLKDFRKLRIPVDRGSIRLRVSPNGKRGIWLDFANVDIKTLLDERIVLDSLRKEAVVEIGQKRKRLAEVDGKLKLVDPVLEPWFETYIGDRAIPLYCTIGSFTQPGFRANRELVAAVSEMLGKTGAHRVAEFGSGIGNFTLPLASVAERVDAYEVDDLALDGLRKSLGENRLEEKVSIHSGNFQGAKTAALDFANVDVMLVDPPRSGLMQFLDPVENAAAKPKWFIYVSCFAESFAADSKRLIAMGYKPRDLAIVDQFPQSRHFEVVSLFELLR
jgi:23S rRNA (uracil1939-C5)-methyltransferase